MIRPLGTLERTPARRPRLESRHPPKRRAVAVYSGRVDASKSRHDRQRLLPWIGDEGQARLRQSHALVVGCGALGSIEAELLLRAGVGMLTLVDRDVVEWSNLQRQSLYGERDAESGAPKAEAAKRRLREIDSSVRVHACVEHVDADNIAELARGVDVIIDGLDNAPTRYLLNDFAVRQGVPFIHAAAVAMEGRSLAVLAGRPCLRCLFPAAPAPGALGTCDTVGVLGPLVNVVGAFAAAQAMRVLVGCRELVTPGLWAFDFTQGRSTILGAAMEPDPSCPCCAKRRFEWLDSPCDDAAVLCGRGAVQIVPRRRDEGQTTRHATEAHIRRSGTAIDLASVSRRLATHGIFVERDGALHGTLADLRSPDGRSVEVTLFADGRAIIGGSSDPDFARGIYDRYIGL